MPEDISRREFLKGALAAIGLVVVSQIPEWVCAIEDEEFDELIEISTQVLSHDEVLDVLDQEDLEEALGLVFTMLLENGIEPEEYLIMQGFLSG